ncbi:rodlin [Nostoc sp.]|uniref:rodlin n=1 Tax=Nostoc sp. TaxID=1180 RepID=UPI002FFB204D
MTNIKVADLESSLFEELSDEELMAVVGGIGNDNGINTVNGNGAAQIYGNQSTYGSLSPQLGLVQGTLNKPCIGLPAKVNVGVQDINVLSNPQNQQCTENSTQAKGDEPLSNILHNFPV